MQHKAVAMMINRIELREGRSSGISEGAEEGRKIKIYRDRADEADRSREEIKPTAKEMTMVISKTTAVTVRAVTQSPSEVYKAMV